MFEHGLVRAVGRAEPARVVVVGTDRLVGGEEQGTLSEEEVEERAGERFTEQRLLSRLVPAAWRCPWLAHTRRSGGILC